MSVEVAGADELYCPVCETASTFAQGPICARDGTPLIRLVVTDPLIGRVLDDRFTLLEKLGQGGMGAVYRARQHSVDREVAIKVVLASLLADPGAIKRFLREARLSSRLTHPNAVGVLDFGQTADGLCYLVMELVSGVTLTRALQSGGGFAPARIIRIGIQICDALESAHAMQIVHRDLKPSNIMLLASGRDFVKVLDFGLAKSLVLGADLSSASDRVLGTPAFAAPEQLEHATCDARADLYSLGCVLYLLASGRMPYPQGMPVEPGARMARLPTVTPALEAVIARLVARRPDDRLQTAAQTRAALEAAAEQPEVVPVFVVPASVPPTQVIARPRSRRRTGWVVAGLLAAAAAIAIAGFARRSTRAADAAPVIPPEPELAPAVAGPDLGAAAAAVRSPGAGSVDAAADVVPADVVPADLAPTVPAADLAPAPARATDRERPRTDRKRAPDPTGNTRRPTLPF